MCNVDDYIKVNRCYKCSRFNRRAQDCKGELTCPIYAENHSLLEREASKQQYKCINCTNLNKYNQKSPINAKHSSMDNSCSCGQNMLRRFTETIDYQQCMQWEWTINCFQISLQHSRAATADLVQLINQHYVDITHIQEPYNINNKLVGLARGHKVYKSGDWRKGTAIVINNDQ